jgi:hypothetical protein
MVEASVGELKGPDGSKAGYEIYILMEWCAGALIPTSGDGRRLMT